MLTALAYTTCSIEASDDHASWCLFSNVANRIYIESNPIEPLVSLSDLLFK